MNPAISEETFEEEALRLRRVCAHLSGELTFLRAQRPETPPLYYLATPYTHPNPDVAGSRVQASLEVAGAYIAKGWHIYNPLAASCPLAAQGSVPPQGWYEYDLAILARCQALLVLQLPGWQESVGVAREIAYAEGIPMAIQYVNPLGIISERLLHACQ